MFVDPANLPTMDEIRRLKKELDENSKSVENWIQIAKESKLEKNLLLQTIELKFPPRTENNNNNDNNNDNNAGTMRRTSISFTPVHCLLVLLIFLFVFLLSSSFSFLLLFLVLFVSDRILSLTII